MRERLWYPLYQVSDVRKFFTFTVGMEEFSFFLKIYLIKKKHHESILLKLLLLYGH